MKAIQVHGKIDINGQLSLDHPIPDTPPSSVRVIILFEETVAENNNFAEQIREYYQRSLMSVEELQQGLNQAFHEAGYDSNEAIINLVQEVKREIYEERQQVNSQQNYSK